MTKSIALLFLFIIAFAGRTLSQSTTAVTESTPAGVYVPGVCICVTQGYCGLAGGGGGSTDGSGEIDPRIMTVIKCCISVFNSLVFH